MKKKALIALLTLVVLIGTVSLISSVRQAQARRALAAYKAQLRAQGEKLTFEEAGYPFPLETNANLENFAVLADQLRAKSGIPGMADVMPFEAPGRAVVIWAGGQLKRSDPMANTPLYPSWEDLSSDMHSAAELLSEIRAELEHPPRHFGWDYTRPFRMTPRNPHVQKRVVAQFLTADTLAALREHQLPRAQGDLHALTQLVQVHRNDLTLVSAMIRVAVSGLAIAATWQALPAEGWDDSALQTLQRDWEAIDLAEALETGLVGERIFGGQAFRMARQTNLDEQARIFPLGTLPKSGMAGIRRPSSLRTLRQTFGRAKDAVWPTPVFPDQ